MARIKRKRTNKDALIKKMQNLVRQEYTDFDYLDELNEEQLEFLAKFQNETLNASFKEDNKQNLIQDPVKQNEIYNQNNARNRCVYGRNRPAKKILTYDFIVEETENEVAEHNEVGRIQGINTTEDAINELLDLKRFGNIDNSQNKSGKRRNKSK